MGLLDHKVAVITGSSRGLGFAIAQAYAAQGASVVLAARSAKALEQAVQSVRGEGFPACGLVCDTSSHSDVEALGRLAIDTYGQIDIWVNNAGASGPYGPTAAVPVNRFEQVLRTNIQGVYYGSITALSHFLPQKSGKLINLLGRGADKPVPLQNAYASSKTWVRSFTLALAKEYSRSGVGIFAFNPGLVLTDMLNHVDVIDGYQQQVMPLQTVMRLWAKPPSFPAQKAVWLASSATDGKTGLNVNVLSPGLIISGALREAWRVIARQPDPIQPIQLNPIPPAISENETR